MDCCVTDIKFRSKTKPWRPNVHPSTSPPPPVSPRRAREGFPNSSPAASTRCSRWKRHATNNSCNSGSCPLFPVAPEVTYTEPHKHLSSSHNHRPPPSLAPAPPACPSSRGARPAGPSTSRTASSSPNRSCPPTSERRSSAASSGISTCEFFDLFR